MPEISVKIPGARKTVLFNRCRDRRRVSIQIHDLNGANYGKMHTIKP